jgi:hypothetical protein
MKFLNQDIEYEKKQSIEELVDEFVSILEPLEEDFFIMTDYLTQAYYIEVHIKADKLISNSTIDVPLDPEDQAEYRANREIVEDHNAFNKMKEDANNGRTFSNVITEYNIETQEENPIKIIGGQHRFIAIKEAYENGNNFYHGVKVYFGLDSDQRLDVQLISNTNIAVSPDLLDRMFETLKGPELRNWCQNVGFLDQGQDFADKKQRTSQITVRMARSFILSYFEGSNFKNDKYEGIDPNPIIASTGGLDEAWEQLKNESNIWDDQELINAAKAYNNIYQTQIDFYSNTKKKNMEYAYKAFNYSIMSAWAYIAGILEENKKRLKRHFDLGAPTSIDPLNASKLAKGKHKTDPENYRGLGTRTDKKERGRLAELFYLQAEKGNGITKPLIDVAIQKYHVKLANIDLKKIESKLI